MREKGFWYKDAIFYEINPRTFYDSSGDGVGDLKGIEQKLEYIASLGVNCIWLLPIFPSPLKDGGYDIQDYYGIHDDLGSLDDLQNLVTSAHRHGMHIILDLVVNHTSDQCEWFQKAIADKGSPYRDYYVWSDTDEKYQEARIIFIDSEDSNWTWSEEAGQYYWHRFYSSQPDLNYDNPAVRDEMKNIMRFWLDMGIDGFRADAVPYLIEREGTNCENLPETHAYLKEMRQLMDEEYPGKILLAEANQWPDDLIPYFSDGDEFHMAFHFPLMPRIYKSIAKGSRKSLVETLKNTPIIPDSCQWCTFLRNHDELTLEMVTESDRQFLWEAYAPEPRMRLNLGVRRRLAPLMGGNKQKVELLYTLLFSLPGAPIIYYGDEIGMGDDIWLNDRDGVRTPMQWSAEKNAGFSTAPSDKLHLPIIAKDEFSYKKINIKNQIGKGNALLERIRKLIGIRQSHPLFSDQHFTILEDYDEAVFAIQRMSDDEIIICFHNLSEQEHSVELDRNYRFLHGSTNAHNKNGDYSGKIKLAPYSYLWLIR